MVFVSFIWFSLIIPLDINYLMLTWKSWSQSFKDSSWHLLNVLISYLEGLLYVYDSSIAAKVMWLSQREECQNKVMLWDLFFEEY